MGLDEGYACEQALLGTQFWGTDSITQGCVIEVGLQLKAPRVQVRRLS